MPIDDRKGCGGQWSTKELVDKYAAPICKVFLDAGVPHFRAEEMFFEVVMKFEEQRPRLTVLRSVGAYIIRIAKNHLIDEIRRQERERLHRQPWSEHYIEHAGNERADSLCLENEYKRYVEAILDTLPPRRREVAELMIAGYKPTEIAEELNIKASTVSGHIKSARYEILLKLRRVSPDTFEGIE